MLLYKPKKNQIARGNRILISITVLGSAGPIRFVVHEEDHVADVIDIALKSYAREGRLPILGSDLKSFALYCPFAGSDALNPLDGIGSLGTRNFMLCKKPEPEEVMASTEDMRPDAENVRKSSGSLKSWINKFLNLKISPH